MISYYALRLVGETRKRGIFALLQQAGRRYFVRWDHATKTWVNDPKLISYFMGDSSPLEAVAVDESEADRIMQQFGGNLYTNRAIERQTQ